jgi:hypothetical protein
VSRLKSMESHVTPSPLSLSGVHTTSTGSPPRCSSRVKRARPSARAGQMVNASPPGVAAPKQDAACCRVPALGHSKPVVPLPAAVPAISTSSAAIADSCYGPEADAVTAKRSRLCCHAVVVPPGTTTVPAAAPPNRERAGDLPP